MNDPPHSSNITVECRAGLERGRVGSGAGPDGDRGDGMTNPARPSPPPSADGRRPDRGRRPGRPIGAAPSNPPAAPPGEDRPPRHRVGRPPIPRPGAWLDIREPGRRVAMGPSDDPPRRPTLSGRGFPKCGRLPGLPIPDPLRRPSHDPGFPDRISRRVTQRIAELRREEKNATSELTSIPFNLSSLRNSALLCTTHFENLARRTSIPNNLRSRRLHLLNRSIHSSLCPLCLCGESSLIGCGRRPRCVTLRETPPPAWCTPRAEVEVRLVGCLIRDSLRGYSTVARASRRCLATTDLAGCIPGDDPGIPRNGANEPTLDRPVIEVPGWMMEDTTQRNANEPSLHDPSTLSPLLLVLAVHPNCANEPNSAKMAARRGRFGQELRERTQRPRLKARKARERTHGEGVKAGCANEPTRAEVVSRKRANEPSVRHSSTIGAARPIPLALADGANEPILNRSFGPGLAIEIPVVPRVCANEPRPYPFSMGTVLCAIFCKQEGSDPGRGCRSRGRLGGMAHGRDRSGFAAGSDGAGVRLDGPTDPDRGESASDLASGSGMRQT